MQGKSIAANQAALPGAEALATKHQRLQSAADPADAQHDDPGLLRDGIDHEQEYGGHAQRGDSGRCAGCDFQERFAQALRGRFRWQWDVSTTSWLATLADEPEPHEPRQNSLESWTGEMAKITEPASSTCRAPSSPAAGVCGDNEQDMQQFQRQLAVTRLRRRLTRLRPACCRRASRRLPHFRGGNPQP